MRLGVSPSQNRARKSIQRVCFGLGQTFVRRDRIWPSNAAPSLYPLPPYRVGPRLPPPLPRHIPHAVVAIPQLPGRVTQADPASRWNATRRSAAARLHAAPRSHLSPCKLHLPGAPAQGHRHHFAAPASLPACGAALARLISHADAVSLASLAARLREPRACRQRALRFGARPVRGRLPPLVRAVHLLPRHAAGTWLDLLQHRPRRRV